MKTNISKENTLIIVAMEQELSLKQAEGWRVLYSGIGKVNAIISATRAFREELPENVINFGTAGSSRDDLYGIHEVTTFKQRDMDLTDIGLPLGITLNDEIGHISFDRPGLSCGTGDSFVTSAQKIDTDLYDMEAYALAKLCLIENTCDALTRVARRAGLSSAQAGPHGREVTPLLPLALPWAH